MNLDEETRLALNSNINMNIDKPLRINLKEYCIELMNFLYS